MPYFKLMVVKINLDVDDVVVKDKQLFICPLYVTTGRNRIVNCPPEECGQWIADIPLPVKKFKPGFWIKRAVCLICNNENEV